MENNKWIKFMSQKKIKALGLLTVLLVILLIFDSNRYVALQNSSGSVSVKYRGVMSILMEKKIKYYILSPGYTPEEAFALDTIVVDGKITDIKNIEINLDGDITYKAIAHIFVKDIFRGPQLKGQTVSVLLDDSIKFLNNPQQAMQNRDIVSAMRPRMDGIFMLKRYASDTCWKKGNAKLYPSDLATFGFDDSENFVFLEDQEGPIFSTWTYSELKNETDFEKIQKYVQEMITKQNR